MTRRARGGACLIACAVLAPLVACSSPASGDGRVQLDFFQFKSEAVATFDAIIADFEAQHPDIDVVQNNVPDAETAFRTRLVREDVPDVITLNVNGVFGEFADAGVLYDWADDPLLDEISPAVVRIVQDLGQSSPGAVNALPFANNSSGFVYNADLLAEQGLEVPTTWTDLLAAMDIFEQAGTTPVYATLKDGWTALPAFNQLVANTVPADFWERLDAGETTFAQEWRPATDQLAELFAFSQPDRFSRDYNAGNQEFAAGDVPFYLQGSFAIPAIVSFEPAFEIGFANLPTTDDAATQLLVSGVDVGVTMGAQPRHPEQSRLFVEYLLQPDVMRQYSQDQSAITPLLDATTGDPTLEPVLPFFDDERVTGYIDHRIPASIPLAAMLQQYLIDGDADAFLTQLDEEWDQVAARRS